MLHVRELKELARGLDAFGFAKQMGPFALMQRPANVSLAPKSRAFSVRGTMPLRPATVKAAPPPVEFQDLLVATLPPPAADGTLKLLIGRSAGSDLVIDDPAVSSNHAVIRWDGAQAIVSELGSSNGTFLNGMKIGSVAPLKNGDQLAFGMSHFIYLLTTELYARILRTTG
jgi:hypothetical protein